MRNYHIQDINLIIGKAHSKEIEIPILVSDAAATQIKIPDQPDLRYARIVAIETVFQSDQKFSQPSNYLIVDGPQATKCTLSLDTNDADDTGYWKVDPVTGEPVIKNGKAVWVPSKHNMETSGRFTSTQLNHKFLALTALHRIQNAGSATSAILGPDPFVRDLQTFYNMYVSWNGNCNLFIAGGLQNTVNQAVVLLVYYSWLDINGMPIPRQ